MGMSYVFYLTADERSQFFYMYQMSKALQLVSRKSLVKYTGIKHRCQPKSLSKLSKWIVKDICTYKDGRVVIYTFASNWNWFCFLFNPWGSVSFST